MCIYISGIISNDHSIPCFFSSNIISWNSFHAVLMNLPQPFQLFYRTDTWKFMYFLHWWTFSFQFLLVFHKYCCNVYVCTFLCMLICNFSSRNWEVEFLFIGCVSLKILMCTCKFSLKQLPTTAPASNILGHLPSHIADERWYKKTQFFPSLCVFL